MVAEQFRHLAQELASLLFRHSDHVAAGRDQVKDLLAGHRLPPADLHALRRARTGAISGLASMACLDACA